RTEKFLKILESYRLAFKSDASLNEQACTHLKGTWENFAFGHTTSAQEASEAGEKMRKLQVDIFSDVNLPKSFFSSAAKLSLDQFKSSVPSVSYSILVLSALDFHTLDGFKKEAQTAQAPMLPVLLDPSGAIVGPFSLN